MEVIRIKWHGEVPVDNIDELEMNVLKDIQQNLHSLDKPSDLWYHTVFLGKGYSGPSVVVWGEEDDDTHFHCQYESQTEWVNLAGEKVNV